MVDSHIIQPERDSSDSSSASRQSLVAWGPEEKSWSQTQVCRQVGNSIVCTQDIWGDAPPNQAFKAIFALQQNLGLMRSTEQIPGQSVYRVSDTEAPPPYYPPGTLSVPGAGLKAEDPYSYHQGGKPGEIARQSGQPGTFDPYSFHPGDRNAPAVPPWIVPPGEPRPMPPGPQRPEDVIKPPATQPKPGDDTPRPAPVPGNPCRPCNPCSPGNGRWYPGKLAGRVLGRVFGGRGRCR